ncbi:hypothetical protein M422DRAFT_29926 [Sphaerobolus stellatus SS14]|uniref:Uncharacterized protein n=1 Tax=Sphaerobolus stellatus (strain SS14) TaxID=990650 RepID=A0A0C9VRN1_SPHS4|nr:hypothetical protein M422DRAFT_29926 [Sphaerobolus stellatus SS14]
MSGPTQNSKRTADVLCTSLRRYRVSEKQKVSRRQRLGLGQDGDEPCHRRRYLREYGTKSAIGESCNRLKILTFSTRRAQRELCHILLPIPIPIPIPIPAPSRTSESSSRHTPAHPGRPWATSSQSSPPQVPRIQRSVIQNAQPKSQACETLKVTMIPSMPKEG